MIFDGVLVVFVKFSILRKVFNLQLSNCKTKQDGRLVSTYFSPNYKVFDQLLRTVKNETTVFNLVFKAFLQTSIPPLISLFNAKEGVSRFYVENVSSHSTKTSRRRTLLCFKKFRLSKNFRDKREWDITNFRRIFFVFTTEKIRRGTPRFRKIPVSKIFMHKKGCITIFSHKNKIKKCR